MKCFGNLYNRIYDLENIRLAHHNARKGKTHYGEVVMIDENPEPYFKQIQDMLKDKTFCTSKYTMFRRRFGKKEREIFKLPYFPDRIIQHCIMQVVEPIWRKSLIRDTYSSIKGRGLHDGTRRVKRALKDKEGTRFCLKLDIKKFYPSVNHRILKQIIRKKIKCQDTLWLLDNIIDSTKGIPIGNYLSQYFGNLVLSEVDHFMKEQCHVKYLFRYCDDYVLLAKSKKYLHRMLRRIKECCKDLKLSLKENYQIFPVDDRGIDFLGYRFFHNFTLLRKAIVNNFKGAIRQIRRNWLLPQETHIVNSIMSYYGWMKHGNCKTLLSKYIDVQVRTAISISCQLAKQRNPLRKVLI